MDDYVKYHIPAFGSWECYDNVPFTQCFDAARQPTGGLLRYSYSYAQDRDLYVAGDLYDNHVVTPAVIVVPRRRRRKVRGTHHEYVKEEKEKSGVEDFKEPLSPTFICRPKPKPVDEDLYKIPPELLYEKPNKKKVLGLFSCCLRPNCYT